MGISLDSDLLKQVRSACEGRGYRNTSYKAVRTMLESKRSSLRIDQFRGEYVAISRLDGGIYGRGPTPLKAVAWALQMYPMFKNEIL